MNPSQLLEVRRPGGNAVAHPEIVIGWQRGGVNASRARYLFELGVDDIQLVLPDVWRAIRHAEIYPRVIAQGGFRRFFMNNVYRNGAVARVEFTSRLPCNRDALNHVTQLRDVLENVADPQRADDFNLNRVKSARFSDNILRPEAIRTS